jgi:hypothetical protein
LLCRAPGPIWEAKVAFFDEIGRCCPGAASPCQGEVHRAAVLPQRQGCAVEGAGDLMHRWPGYRAHR